MKTVLFLVLCAASFALRAQTNSVQQAQQQQIQQQNTFTACLVVRNTTCKDLKGATYNACMKKEEKERPCK
jgi:hypothetical protein